MIGGGGEGRNVGELCAYRNIVDVEHGLTHCDRRQERSTGPTDILNVFKLLLYGEECLKSKKRAQRVETSIYPWVLLHLSIKHAM